jgi:GR25 family glycosyltransferase involved in LPS biosynthesis
MNKKMKIINLEMRKDRKLYIETQLAKLNINPESYDFFKAINGNEIPVTRQLYNLFGSKKNNYLPKKMEIGCTLSHLSLWGSLIHDQINDYYIILEDDVLFVDDFKEKLEYCCQEFESKNMHYLLIGALNINTLNTDLSNLSITQRELEFNEGAHGYIIDKNACVAILSFFKKDSIYLPIDNASIYNYIFDNKVFSVNEILVKQSHGSTNIQNSVELFDFSEFENK